MNLPAERKTVRKGLLVVSADMIYVLVPIAVTVFVVCEKAGHWRSVIDSPEWAFAAAILLGQAGARLLAGTAVEPRLSWEMLTFIAAALFFLEAITLATLLLLLTSEGKSGLWLSIVQIVLFLSSIPIFLFIGLLSHTWHSRNRSE